MPRKDGKKNALTSELDSFKPEQSPKEQKIDLGDGAGLKRALDDTAVQVLQENGYTEDTTLSNIKIGGGLFTCALAVIAQFYPKKYPENFWVLLVCVVLYMASTLALNLVFSIFEGDLFFISKAKGRSAVYLESKLPRFSDQYKLRIGRKTNKWSRHMTRGSVVLENSLMEYFDSNGTLVEQKFKSAVAAQLKKYESLQKKFE